VSINFNSSMKTKLVSCHTCEKDPFTQNQSKPSKEWAKTRQTDLQILAASIIIPIFHLENHMLGYDQH